MHPFIKNSLSVIWLIVLLFWVYGALKTKVTLKSEGKITQFLFYWLPLLITVYLLGPGEWFGHTWLRENFVPHNNAVGIPAIILCFLGGFICCWARITLGKNWSLSVTIKKQHHLIISGPYKYVRHPIYTGLLLLFLGNVFIVGDYRGILAYFIISVAFWCKLKKEEQWLTTVFKDDYINYCTHTKALIPRIL